MIQQNDAVTSMIEYIFITSILLLFMVITIPLVTSVFIEQPANQLTTSAFMDIGNGVSTRIIDLYTIVPYGENKADIITKFDIPDDVAGKDYWVEISQGTAAKDNKIIISRGDYHVNISLAGIGATKQGKSGGRTTASGVNSIEYHYPLNP